MGNSEKLGPLPERLRHGPVELVPETVKYTRGAPAQPYRAVDTIETLLRRATIHPRDGRGCRQVPRGVPSRSHGRAAGRWRGPSRSGLCPSRSNRQRGPASRTQRDGAARGQGSIAASCIRRLSASKPRFQDGPSSTPASTRAPGPACCSPRSGSSPRALRGPAIGGVNSAAAEPHANIGQKGSRGRLRPRHGSNEKTSIGELGFWASSIEQGGTAIAFRNTAGARPSTSGVGYPPLIGRSRMPGRSRGSGLETWRGAGCVWTYPGRGLLRPGARERTACPPPVSRYPVGRSVFSRSGRAARSWPRRPPALAPQDYRRDGGPW